MTGRTPSLQALRQAHAKAPPWQDALRQDLDRRAGVDRVPDRVHVLCVKTGSRWVHLRTCQECGGTRCCDSSPNRHASKHAAASGHPVVASGEPGERWVYCYPDDAFAEY